MLSKLATPLSGIGDFVALGVESARELFHRPFQWRETVEQSWAIARVSMVPTLLVAIPIGVIVSIQVSNIAGQIGATSFSGAATGLGVIRQGAPLVTSLLLAGAVGSAKSTLTRTPGKLRIGTVRLMHCIPEMSHDKAVRELG